MSLNAGTRLGPYEILAPIGAGGMVRREPSSIPTRINVVFNWLEELERLVPTEK